MLLSEPRAFLQGKQLPGSCVSRAVGHLWLSFPHQGQRSAQGVSTPLGFKSTPWLGAGAPGTLGSQEGGVPLGSGHQEWGPPDCGWVVRAGERPQRSQQGCACPEEQEICLLVRREQARLESRVQGSDMAPTGQGRGDSIQFEQRVGATQFCIKRHVKVRQGLTGLHLVVLWP